MEATAATAVFSGIKSQEGLRRLRAQHLTFSADRTAVKYRNVNNSSAGWRFHYRKDGNKHQPGAKRSQLESLLCGLAQAGWPLVIEQHAYVIDIPQSFVHPDGRSVDMRGVLQCLYQTLRGKAHADICRSQCADYE